MITKNHTSRTLIIHPVGDLDALQAEHYRRQLRSLIEEGYRYLIFDLAETSFINSCGLGLLVEFYNTVTRLEGSLKLINCGPHAFGLLQQTHLDKVLLQDPGSGAGVAETSVKFDSLHALMSEEILFLAQVHQVTEQILNLEEPGAINEAILKGAVQALRAERGALFLLGENDGRLTLAHWQGREGEARPRFDDAILRAGHKEHHLIEQNDVAWHHESDRDTQSRGLLRQVGFETALIAPIRGRRRKYGLLVIEASDETGKIIKSAKPLIQTFTNICGLALERATLIRQYQSQAGELEALGQRSQEYHHSLIDAGKLASLGVVISGLSHLMNNKMVPLIGYTQMLSQKKDLPPWVADKVARIHASSNEVSHIVEKMVKISHQRDNTRKVVEVGDLIRTAIDLLSGQIERSRIVTHIHVPVGGPLLQGDADFLLQAILAVLHRACTSFAENDDERWVRVVTSVSGANMRIVIEDNGSDFDEFDQDGWIDPLVPDEAMKQGRMFNYNIPRSIVRRHQGGFMLEPRAERGKRVILDLPICLPPVELASAVAPSAPPIPTEDQGGEF